MEVIRFIVFLTGVALVSGQCNESKMEQCLNQTNGAFTNNNGIQDISNLCSESTKTALVCFKNEMNKCSSSLSFKEKEELSLVNRITVEGLQKVCNIFANMGKGSYGCFSRAVENYVSSIRACIQSDSAFANANVNTATLLCRTFDVTYKCGLEPVRKDCPTHVDDFRSWRDAVKTLFACEDSGKGHSDDGIPLHLELRDDKLLFAGEGTDLGYSARLFILIWPKSESIPFVHQQQDIYTSSGNSSNRYNSAPTFLLIALGVQVLVAVGL